MDDDDDEEEVAFGMPADFYEQVDDNGWPIQAQSQDARSESTDLRPENVIGQPLALSFRINENGNIVAAQELSERMRRLIYGDWTPEY